MSHCAGQRRAPAPAHTYNVDATAGSDTATGHEDAPLKTIAAANALTFKPGDRVLLKRGETWAGTRITIGYSGKPGRPIVYGAYGAGALPIINAAGANDAIFADGKSYVSVFGIQGQGADNAATGYGVRLQGGCSYITLDGVKIASALREGIFIDACSYITVADCEATAAFVGLQFWGASHHCTVSGGSYYSNDEEGANAEDGSHHIEFIGVTAHDNVKAGFDVADATTTDLMYRRCAAYANGDDGFSIYTGGSRTRYENCLAYNNSAHGIEVQAGAAGDGIEIEHCTSAGNAYRNYNIQVGTTLLFRNNIGRQCGYNEQLKIFAGVTYTADYNCYWREGGVTKNVLGATTYDTLANWQTATSQEAHSLFSDPVLVNPAIWDLHLQTTSPCKDAGVDAGVAADYDSVARDVTPAIGAYEYVAA